MKNINQLLSLLLLLLATSGCIKQEFDEPPLGGEPVNLTPNVTIAQVKALHQDGQIETITEDWIIAGEVVMDDRSGNYYKTLVIQDASGGLEVKFQDGFLFNNFPIGRTIFIKAKDLKLTDYNGVVQLIGNTLVSGTTVDELGLTALQVQTKVFKGAIATTPVAPKQKSILSLTPNDVSTLIQLSDVEFAGSDAGVFYAEPVAKITRNRYVQDCNGIQIIVRTSGFADFAGVNTPTGKGTLTGVLSAFNGEYQLYLRSAADAQMTGDRCGSGGTGNQDLMDISALRAVINGGGVAGPANKKIKGVVISNVAAGNIVDKNMVIQDATGGIAVRFAAAHSFVQGDEVEVNISDAELSLFNGLQQVNNLPLARASKTGSGTVTARTATIAELKSNLNAWESTLVKIVGATISGGATYNGNLTVTDASGNIPMFTRSFANFSANPVPTGTVSVTAILSNFNGSQLNMRVGTDVEGGGGGGTGGTVTQMDISALRSVFTGTTTVAPALKKIKGLVISDVAAMNITGRNIVIQDGTAGIVVRFDANQTWAVGDELEIEVSGMELSEFSGLLQVNNVPSAKAKKVGTGTPAVRTATIAQVLANANAWESTLVRIQGVTLSGASTYSGNLTATDASGNIPFFTRSQATFAGSALPTAAVNLTAIVSDFNGAQLNIRNLQDVQ